MKAARITIFAGHYGSGKTNLAINFALRLAQSGKPTTICDLDIVNPYFRTADYASLFEANDIRLLASSYANSSLDVPSLPPGALSLFDDKSRYGIIDLGGDDRGALALGRFAKALDAPGTYDMLLVVNIYRPLSREISDIIKIKQDIEKASGVRFTAMINNPNLGRETEPRHIRDSLALMQGLSEEIGLAVKYTAATRDIAKQLGIDGIFPIQIYEKSAWKVR